MENDTETETDNFNDMPTILRLLGYPVPEQDEAKCSGNPTWEEEDEE